MEKVFVSSVGAGLHEFRKEVCSVINLLDGFHSVCMEDFGARNRSPLNTCRRKLEESDYFVGIVGPNYGSCPQQTDKSFTEIEYDWACSLNKPCLMFMTPDDFPVASSVRESDTKRERQEFFRERVLGECTVGLRCFVSPAHLAMLVAVGLANLDRVPNNGTPSASSPEAGDARHGQINPFSCSILTNQIRSVRPAGISELLDDILLKFSGDPGESRATNINVLFNINVTSRLIFDPLSEATLSIASTESTAHLPTLSRPVHARNGGVNVLSFFDVPLHELRLLPEGQRNFRLSNVRLNAAQLGALSIVDNQEAARPIQMFISFSPPIDQPRPQAELGRTCKPVQITSSVVSPIAESCGKLKFKQSTSENASLLGESPPSALIQYLVRFVGKLSDPELFPGEQTKLMLRFQAIPNGVSIFVTASAISTEPSPLQARIVNTDVSGSSDSSGRRVIDGEGVLDSKVYPISRIPISRHSGIAAWELSGAGFHPEQSVTVGLIVAYIGEPQRCSPHLGAASVTGSLSPLSTVVTQSSRAAIPRFVDFPITMEFFTIDL